MMKLIYQIPDKLYYIQNFLDYPTYKKLHYDIFKSKLINLESTEQQWQKSLRHGHKNFVKNKTNLGMLQEIENTIEAYLPVVKAIILMENGEQPYDDETILKGMNLAWESYRK